MSVKLVNAPQTTADGWDLFRLSRAKSVVDISVNTLRAYHKMGLRFYRVGKSIFISKAELDAFIRTRSAFESQSNNSDIKGISSPAANPNRNTCRAARRVLPQQGAVPGGSPVTPTKTAANEILTPI